MDVANLKTASTYINNLLLARGLLRNDAPIELWELAAPDREDDTSARTTRAAAVLNLVHDLILRRDVSI